jgi:hypothetical protein
MVQILYQFIPDTRPDLSSFVRVGGTGLEPATSAMSTQCSNQLSYPPNKVARLYTWLNKIARYTQLDINLTKYLSVSPTFYGCSRIVKWPEFGIIFNEALPI